MIKDSQMYFLYNVYKKKTQLTYVHEEMIITMSVP